LQITCVEAGSALVAAARRNLVGFDGVKIEQIRFEAGYQNPNRSIWSSPPRLALGRR
jgi:hypothetical protein